MSVDLGRLLPIPASDDQPSPAVTPVQPTQATHQKLAQEPSYYPDAPRVAKEAKSCVLMGKGVVVALLHALHRIAHWKAKNGFTLSHIGSPQLPSLLNTLQVLVLIRRETMPILLPTSYLVFLAPTQPSRFPHRHREGLPFQRQPSVTTSRRMVTPSPSPSSQSHQYRRGRWAKLRPEASIYQGRSSLGLIHDLAIRSIHRRHVLGKGLHQGPRELHLTQACNPWNVREKVAPGIPQSSPPVGVES